MVDTIREKVILIMCSHVRRNARISERFAFLLCISNDSTLQTLCGSTHKIVNDEGKLIGLDLNRSLRDDHGEIYDIVAGTFLVVGLGEEDFTSLSPDLIQKYTEHFKHPELFANINGQIVSVPVEPNNPLRTAEMTLEDDYGMIDGVINNGRRGEEQEKAAENAEKKSSIMDRLADAKKECADHKPAEKAAHHKKPPELGDL